MSRPPKGTTLRHRLEEKRKILKNGCWKWTGMNTSNQLKNHPNNLVYGRIKVGKREQKTHRAAWTVYRGAIPSGKNVLHKCDFGLCFNPRHLFLGTQLENMRDCSRKGRIPIGQRNVRAKLTNSRVRKIRAFHKPWDRKRSARATARKFGICKTLAGQIIRGERWSHVK